MYLCLQETFNALILKIKIIITSHSIEDKLHTVLHYHTNTPPHDLDHHITEYRIVFLPYYVLRLITNRNNSNHNRYITTLEFHMDSNMNVVGNISHTKVKVVLKINML